jgi:hypothetical protein
MTDEQKRTDGTSEKAPEVEATPQAKQVSRSEPSAARKVIRWIFRLLVVIFLGIALGAGLYYGVRSFYRDAIEPLQTMDQRTREVETKVTELYETVREDKRSASEGLTDVQGRLAVQAEEIATLTSQLNRLEGQTADQAKAFDKVAELRDDVDQVEDDFNALDAQLADLEQVVQAEDLPVEQVQESLQLMRVMILLTRARLWVEQDNFGLAGEDMDAAIGIMNELLIDNTDAEGQPDDALLAISNQLTLASDNVRENPALAEEELEIAWKLLFETTAP